MYAIIYLYIFSLIGYNCCCCPPPWFFSSRLNKRTKKINSAKNHNFTFHLATEYSFLLLLPLANVSFG